jgi:hypothetical protein
MDIFNCSKLNIADEEIGHCCGWIEKLEGKVFQKIFSEFLKVRSLVYRQGDQIGWMLAHWVIVYFGQLF